MAFVYCLIILKLTFTSLSLSLLHFYFSVRYFLQCLMMRPLGMTRVMTGSNSGSGTSRKSNLENTKIVV